MVETWAQGFSAPGGAGLSWVIRRSRAQLGYQKEQGSAGYQKEQGSVGLSEGAGLSWLPEGAGLSRVIRTSSHLEAGLQAAGLLPDLLVVD